MLVSFIVTFIVIFALGAIIASSSSAVNVVKTKEMFKRSSFAYNIEKIIWDATEYTCINDPSFCKNKEDANGNILLSYDDIAGNLPASFKNDNQMGGTFTAILVTDSHRTIAVKHSIPDRTQRHIYLSNYEGERYGTKPQCVSGSDPCDSEEVYHEFATSLDFRKALQ